MSFRTRRFFQAGEEPAVDFESSAVPHPRFSGDFIDLATHSNQTQTCHSDRSGAAFSSSFAPANEPRRAVEESLFDLSRSQLVLFFEEYYARGLVRLAPFGQSCLNLPSSIFRFFITLV